MLSGQAKSTQKVKKIYVEPCLTGRQASHKPLPDTAIFSGHRTVAATQQFEPLQQTFRLVTNIYRFLLPLSSF
jgi:hypothetical protein